MSSASDSYIEAQVISALMEVVIFDNPEHAKRHAQELISALDDVGLKLVPQ